MNVLMFTMTMILLIATMTYAKLEHFKVLKFSNLQYEHYLEKNERIFSNEEAYSKYKNTHISAHKSTPRAPRTGISKLSLSILFDATEREKDPAKLKEVIDLSKKLILNLFSNVAVIQETMQNTPDILDRFFISLMNETDKIYSDQKKMKDILELASIDFHDEKLNEFSYALFKTYTHPEDAIQESKKLEYSLLDEFTLQKEKTKLYLASRDLLNAIFNQNSSLVNEILDKRTLLYKQTIKAENNNEASLEFKEYMMTLCPYLNPNLFDFSVTKTNPKKYE